MPTTFNPVFIVALGGTGTQVARQLRDRLEWRYGDVEQIPFLSFLFIDTDNNNPDAAGPDGIIINPPAGQIPRMLANPEEFDAIGLKSWIDMEALKRADKGGFQQGASGVRMFGRLAFLAAQSFQNMWQQLGHRIVRVCRVTDTDIKDALGLPPEAEVSVGPARCYVISSSCGGTGSGTFVDLGYILAEILQKEGIQAERIGICAIAREDATSERQYGRNTSALLSELDYYNRSGVTYDAKYPQQPPVQSRGAAYDYCYLVSPSGPKGQLDFNRFLNNMAEYVYVDMIAQTQEAQSRRVDFGPDMAEFDLDGYPLRFLTLGVSSIEFPADVCHKACYHGTVCDFVETWLHTDSRRVEGEGMEPLPPSDPDAERLRAALGIGFSRPQDDHLLAELTRVPEELADVAGGIAPQDWMNEQVRRTFDAELTPESFTDLERRLEGALAKDGYLSKCVELNTKRLRGARSLDGLLLEAVLPVVFDLARGPRYALGVVRRLQDELKAEMARISTELNTPLLPGYTLEDARSAVEAVRRDWLLRLPPLIGFTWINNHAARREMQRPRLMICDAYNRRAERLVLQAKWDLYTELADPALQTLERRLVHLLEYLMRWRAESAQDYTAIVHRPLDRRTGMLFSEAVVQQKMDRVMKNVDEGTRTRFHASLLAPDRVAELRSAISALLDRDETRPFTVAYPRDAARGGGIQLRYVDAIGAYIRDRYRQRAAPGETPIIYDERVIERFQEAATQAGGLATEIAAVVEESMEMAELNLQHPKYTDIQPVNPRDGWWAFFNGAAAPQEWTEFKRQLNDSVHAAAGNTGVTAPDVGRWLQEIADPYTVILLRERAAYPTRIIRGYDISDREAKLQDARATAGRVAEITAFSRTGIRPKPPSARDIREAEQFFVGGVLLGLLQYSQERQEFSLELAGGPGTPRRLLALSCDFGATVNDLAYRETTRTSLAELLQAKINELGKEKVLEITGSVKGRVEMDAAGHPRTHEMAILGFRDLPDDQGVNVILGFEEHYELVAPTPAGQGTVHPYADLISDPPVGRPVGFYCRNAACGIFLGKDLEAIPPVCPNCGRSFVVHTD